MNSKTLAKHQAIDAEKLESFLFELANVRGDSVRRFLSKYREMLSDFPTAEKWLTPHGDAPRDQLEQMRILNLSSLLGNLWRQKTVEAKQFRILHLMELAKQKGHVGFDLYPPDSTPGPFAQALLYLLKSANRIRVCGNPDCHTTPCFFRHQKRQTYCSEPCAEFGQRKAKQKWWSDKGDEWRQNRKRMENQARKGGKRGTKQTW
jgi:hypothetical protein